MALFFPIEHELVSCVCYQVNERATVTAYLHKISK